jgi:hypothetical protein
MSALMAFQLGQVVATPGALEALRRNNSTGLDYIRRHSDCDWGDLCAEDKKANEEAMQSGARLMSSYFLPDETKLWVITDATVNEEGKGLVTTLLLPEEY